MTRKSAVVTDRSGSRVIFGSDELHVLIFQAEIVESFLNEVRILIAYVAELRSRHSDEKYSGAGVAVASGFEPGVVGMAVDLFLERIEDA
jgi:hypothetical protein